MEPNNDDRIFSMVLELLDDVVNEVLWRLPFPMMGLLATESPTQIEDMEVLLIKKCFGLIETGQSNGLIIHSFDEEPKH